MPVRIVDIPGIQSTRINAAPMSAAAASAGARGLGELAQGIAGISEPFAKIAGNLQNTENLRKESEIRTTLDERLTQFRIDVDKDPDPASRLRKMDSFLQQQKSIVDEPGISPVVRDRMIPYFDGWATNARNGNAVQAAQLSQQRAKLQFQNEQQSAFENNDRGRLKLGFDTAVAAGAALPEEWNDIEHDFNEKQRKDQTLRNIYDNPAGYLEENESPPESGNLVEWENNRTIARQLLRKETVDANDKFQDLLASGQVTTPEQIDALWGDQRPSVIASFKEDLAKKGSADFKARAATPEYQDEVVGKVSTMLDGYQLDADGFDEKFVQMDSMVRTLPEGSAAKAELSKQLDRVRGGQEQQLATAADMARKSFVDAFKGSLFGTTIQSQSTQSAIDAGLLRNRDKLKEAGFSDESLEYITGKKQNGKESEKLSDTERKRRFLERYPQRADKKTPSDPFLQRAFEALQAGESQIEYEDPVAARKAEVGLGKARSDFETWLRIHPDKVNDEDAVMRKTYEIVSPFGIDKFRNSLIPPRPVGPPPISLDGPLPEIQRDVPMDWIPGVLPSANPR